ncbi:hypothetical protein [Micromonospora sp. HUAS LYJ1]|uniref:hypothetical protein n=1 Tax=Micromonospora sp. HUAS LYJ1 TaxID=3061626 RepID=UPI002670EF62|nr:hypothetical protein [Micromonospora sp. HUAS LYJ1]WKU05636.1 hypothetical protein Q2K16_00785 [Micromonospora sp. HUAS LYJ1]
MFEAVEQFITNPGHFLQNNALICKLDLGPELRIEHFTLQRAPEVDCRGTGGSPIPAWKVVVTPATTVASFEAFWVPYSGGRGFSDSFRSKDSRFVLTPMLDGCTVAYRHEADRLRVGHYNFVHDPTGTGTFVIDQAAIDARVAADFAAGPGGPVRRLRKADYKLATDLRGGEGVQVTAVGVRQDSDDPLGHSRAADADVRPWTFLYQKRQIRAAARDWNDLELSGVYTF